MLWSTYDNGWHMVLSSHNKYQFIFVIRVPSIQAGSTLYLPFKTPEFSKVQLVLLLNSDHFCSLEHLNSSALEAHYWTQWSLEEGHKNHTTLQTIKWSREVEEESFFLC
jgi:ribulose bisphosphate carboxylase small subunit